MDDAPDAAARDQPATSAPRRRIGGRTVTISSWLVVLIIVVVVWVTAGSDYAIWSGIWASIFAFLSWFVRNVDVDPEAIERARKEKPRLPAEGSTVKETLVLAGFLWAIFAFFGTIAVVVDDGPGTLLRRGFWEVIGALAVALVGLSFFFNWSGEMTRTKWLRQIRKRAARRGGAARCLSVLGAEGATERQAWYSRMSHAVRWRVFRRVIALPLVAFCVGLIVAQEFMLEGTARWVVLAIVALLFVVVGLLSTLDTLGAPLLLVGRVTRGVTVITISPSDRPTPKKLANTWIQKGSVRTAMIDVHAAAELAADGALHGAPGWRGQREVGMRWRASRRLIEGEHCVLMCDSNGLIFDRLTDFARASHRRRAFNPNRQGYHRARAGTPAISQR